MVKRRRTKSFRSNSRNQGSAMNREDRLLMRAIARTSRPVKAKYHREFEAGTLKPFPQEWN